MVTDGDGTTRGGDNRTSAVTESTDEETPAAPARSASSPKKNFKSLDDAFNDLMET
jgi:hypothetical protein